MDQEELIPHLFRTEYRKIVAVLAKRFGFDQIETAEDIASDTFLTATQAWGLDGIPKNPVAWLYHVAKNKAINHLQRDSLFEKKIVPVLQSGASGSADPGQAPAADEIDLSPQNIRDSQLQMIFAVCHPCIAPEAQIGLSLRVLCGFGIGEIADAFLTNKETINKRLFRAKERLREERIPIGLPDVAALDERLASVLTTLYLLFNEGYYSVSRDQTLRKELCLEAIRLCTLLIENESTNRPSVNALLALMCFHISRFEARLDGNGGIVLYDDQDAGLWNSDWIGKGGYFLRRAGTGGGLSKYHLEAGIAYWHTQKADTPEKWEHILLFYNQLLQIEYSPVAALNRVYALSKANGKQEAIVAAEKLAELKDNHFYFTLLGELHTGMDNHVAMQNFQKALALAKTVMDKRTIRKKMDRLGLI